MLPSTREHATGHAGMAARPKRLVTRGNALPGNLATKNEPHGLACVNQMAEEEGFAGRSAPSPRRAPCGACGLRWKTRSRFLSSAPSRVRIMQGLQKNEPHGLACVNQMAEEEGFEPSYGEYP